MAGGQRCALHDACADVHAAGTEGLGPVREGQEPGNQGRGAGLTGQGPGAPAQMGRAFGCAPWARFT